MQSGSWYRPVVLAIVGLLNLFAILFAIFKFFGGPNEKAVQKGDRLRSDHVRGLLLCRWPNRRTCTSQH